MSRTVAAKLALVPLVGYMAVAGCVAPPPPRVVAQAPARHPAYLHALSDLRAARWLIEHRAPGDPAQSVDEGEAVRQIDAAIGDIKQAAMDDGKNLNDRPAVDEHPDRRGRIHQALQILRKARADIAREEDSGFANGLRDRAVGHIDGAIGAARRVLQE
jgi:hypothetical protein